MFNILTFVIIIVAIFITGYDSKIDIYNFIKGEVHRSRLLQWQELIVQLEIYTVECQSVLLA